MYKTTILNFSNLVSANAAAVSLKVNLVRLLIVFAMFLSASTLVAQNGMATTGNHFCHSCQPDDDTSTVNTAKGGVSPFGSGWQNQKSQYLYMASELTGTPNIASAGPITSVAFYVTKLPNNAPFTLKNYNVKIGHTTMTKFSNGNTAANGYAFGTEFNLDGKVETTIGDLTITQTGWHTLEFSEPFMWDGVSNIIVEICKSNTSVAAVGVNYEVRATDYDDNNFMRTRSFYTQNPSGATHPVAGCEMNGGTMSLANNCMKLASANQDIRPDARFQFGCTGTPAAGVAATAGVAVGNGCPELTLTVNNGAQNADLSYVWMSADNVNMVGAQIVPGEAHNETLKITLQPTDKYYARKTGCGGSFIFSEAKLVQAAAVNVYNGTWSAGAPTETSNKRLVINGNVTLPENSRACGCEVKEGVAVTVPAGATLQIDSDLKVLEGGSLTFEEGASLIQKNPYAVNTGNIIYKRASQPLLRYDFTYWSSPVQNQTLAGFSPLTLSDKFLSFNSAVQNWAVENSSNQMVAGKGYIIRAPQAFNISGAQTVFNGMFTGKPNNGTINVPITTGTGKFNLIGNPYASAVDAAAFFAANESKLDGTFYFWTHHTPVTNMNYNSNDYAVMNLMGSVTPTPTWEAPSTMIGAGQSFMIKAKPGSSVGSASAVFTNEMRRGAGQNGTFFREAAGNDNIAQAIDAQKHRVWLDLRNGQGFKQILVGYSTAATTGYDAGFDGDAMAGSVLSFYSKQDAAQYAIQGRPAFTITDQVPLGFSTTVAGNQTLSLSNYDGLFSTQSIYLEDKVLNVFHDLKSGPYTFASATGTFQNRFVLRYDVSTLKGAGVKAVATTATDSTITNSESIVIFRQNQDLRIDGGIASIGSVKVYDLSGRLLTSQSGNNSNEVLIANPNWSSQVLIVQLTTTDKTIITKKVVF